MLIEDLKQSTSIRNPVRGQLNELPGDLPGYLALLEDFFGFVEPWEQRLALVLAEDDPVVFARAKTPWLEADLAHFGYSEDAIGNLPRCAALPAAATREEILGAAYVIEGTTLGGEFVVQYVGSALGLGPEGCRFFRGYGAETGPRWEALREELLRHESSDRRDAIVRGAQETFAKFEAWFAARRLAA